MLNKSKCNPEPLWKGNWSKMLNSNLTMLGVTLILHCPYISSSLLFWIEARLEHRIFWRNERPFFKCPLTNTLKMILFYLQLFSATWKGLLLFYFVLTIHLKYLWLVWETLVKKCLVVCLLTTKCQIHRNIANTKYQK